MGCGALGKGDCDLPVTDFDAALALDEIAADLGSITGLEAAQVLGQATVRVSANHRHDHVEVDLDQDR